MQLYIIYSALYKAQRLAMMYFEWLKCSKIGSDNNVVGEYFVVPGGSCLSFSQSHEVVMKFTISKVSSMLISFYNM